MPKSLKLFLTTFNISFMGALPLGTLNTNVAGYALNADFRGALQFGLGAMLVEVILVRLALLLMEKLMGLRKLFFCLCIFACLLLFFLAFKSIEAAYQGRSFQEVLPFASRQPFYSGITLSLLNPLHLPFWMGWTAVLKGKNILESKPAAYNLYMIAIGVGTCMAFVVYGLAGNFLMTTFRSAHIVINWIFGATLLLSGLLLAYRLIAWKLENYNRGARKEIQIQGNKLT